MHLHCTTVTTTTGKQKSFFFSIPENGIELLQVPGAKPRAGVCLVEVLLEFEPEKDREQGSGRVWHQQRLRVRRQTGLPVPSRALPRMRQGISGAERERKGRLAKTIDPR